MELSRAMDWLWSAHVGGLVVTDEEERPIGLFTQTEALLARELPPEDDARGHVERRHALPAPVISSTAPPRTLTRRARVGSLSLRITR